MAIPDGDDLVVQMSNINHWGAGSFLGHFVFPIKGEEVQGWEVILNFSSPVTGLMEWMGDIVKRSKGNKEYIIVNKPHTAVQHTGQTLDIAVQGISSSGSVPTATGRLINMAHDGFSISTFPDKDGTKYNYNDVLHKSIMFYEAQRSGKLPADNEIPWRGDSALNDTGDRGEDLTGGWYDGAGSNKFGFPMAASTTLLGWGLLQYKDAYQATGLLDKMYDCIRWPLEWMLKCHTRQDELYIQIGDPNTEYGVWDRPESMTITRPAHKLDPQHPGSDVAGEYAAAMAVGYLVFREKNPMFARRLLNHAKQINDFALNYKGKFSDSIHAANGFYSSTNYKDELSWAGVWLYKATNESKYLHQAETYYEQGTSWAMSWDDKDLGAKILLYNITGKDMYRQDIEATLRDWMPGGSVPYTPKGLAYRNEWGSLMYSSNMAFMALLAADAGLHADEYRKWARSQIHYALGDAGRSYVCGFGTNPPTQPNHKGASCPMYPVPCGWTLFSSTSANPHVLYGALVAGPDLKDVFRDERKSTINTEVTCAYNSGFQSAVAGLKSVYMRSVMTTQPSVSTPTTITTTTTTMSTTSLPTTVSTTSLPTTMSTTSLPTTMSTTSLPTTKSTTSLPTSMSTTSLPTTMSTTSLPTSLPTTSLPTTMSTTSLPTSLPTIMSTTSMSTTSMPTTSLTKSSALTTQVPSSKLTTAKMWITVPLK